MILIENIRIHTCVWYNLIDHWMWSWMWRILIVNCLSVAWNKFDLIWWSHDVLERCRRSREKDPRVETNVIYTSDNQEKKYFVYLHNYIMQ